MARTRHVPGPILPQLEAAVAAISPDGMRLVRTEVAVLAVLVLLFIAWLLTDHGD